MSQDISRREFAKLAVVAGGVAITGFDLHTRSWVTESQAQGPSFRGIPKLDGAFLLDDANRTAFAIDGGKLFHRIPAAVLQPGSVQDIIKIVKYANTHGLKIGTKGVGHSCYGQTQAEAGIGIDSRTLNSVRLNGTASVDAQPGALWSVVALVTLAAGLTPPVFPATCLALTVGGVLSAGGIGNTSHHHGAVVDTVTELDVVTGDGRLVTCSAHRNAELFNMVLGGQGQCGVIVRASFPLSPAPSHVVLHELIYADLDKYLADQGAIAKDGRFDSQRGSAIRKGGGPWSYSIEVGKFTSTSGGSDFSGEETNLLFDRATAPVRMTYQQYLFRFEARNAAEVSDRPTPKITMWVPASSTKTFLAPFLALGPGATGLLHADGGETISLYPMNTRRFTRPLFKLPAEDQAFAVWLFRSVPKDDTAALSAVMDSNRELLGRLAAIGGKSYVPYTMTRTPKEWTAHFGSDVWKRYSAAKKAYDPNHVLSPWPAMFVGG